MPIPPLIFLAVSQIVVRLAPLAYKAGRLARRSEIVKVSKDYSVSIVRRLTLGGDGGMSQIVKILKKGKVQQIWHMVVKNGKIIHKDLK